MKISLLFIFSFFFCFHKSLASEPDSVYIFAYATQKNQNHNGLHFAWSTDKKSWFSVGPEHSFVKNDYGRWGSQKKMFSPFLTKDSNGTWHLIWSLNDTDGAIGHASSTDLVYWGRQSYPILLAEGECLNPEIRKKGNQFIISWNTKGSKSYQTTTSDFKNFSTAQANSAEASLKTKITVLGNTEEGTLHKVPYAIFKGLLDAHKMAGFKRNQEAERVALDATAFKSPLTAQITPLPKDKKQISDLLMGVFFEDINYAADGGIYAELVQNRGFEYDPSDKEGRDKNWDSQKAWSVNVDEVKLFIDTIRPIHVNNKHYAVLTIKKQGSGLVNEGFDGIPVKAGETYLFSVFARSAEKKKGKLLIKLTDKNGNILSQVTTGTVSGNWKKHEASLQVKTTVADAKLEVVPLQTGRVDLDMISLFPKNTFKGHKNGLRADLAQSIADLKPRFVRFPGGCVAHGDGIANMYRWENTIGPLETRKPQRNMWGYHQTAGLGYFEYFQYCEDLDAEPVPIVAAGVPCQNSAHHGCAIGGQQGGIPLEHMDEYVQSVLNLIEYANGSEKSEWGSKRAAAGHPAPFNLKYIGVGNEDLITDIFEERFKLIYDAVKAKYPEITVIGTVGPFNEGTDYVEGWKLAKDMKIPMVDEHYYQTPGWYLNNQSFYDAYDRAEAKVYLGEYAAHIPGRHNNVETALSEALHLINIERNGDIVSMASYAPLLAKEGYTQWNPDLIYFNNTEVKPTVGYHVQQLFGQNSGTSYIPSNISTTDMQVSKRVAASFVTEENDVIIKLVNLLPVEVGSSIDLSPFSLAAKNAELTVLKGELDDKLAKPASSTIAIEKTLEYRLPPYSFSVIKIK
jgi:alpha-L-arabinofuranosidase